MILMDTGPLVAIVSAQDQHHAECVSSFEGIQEPLGTVWPVISESMHLLASYPQGQEAVWSMFRRGGIGLLPLDLGDIMRIRELMRQYADQPMDLADAALVTVAEREGIRTIFTVDKRDFSVYRLHGRGRLKIIP